MRCTFFMNGQKWSKHVLILATKTDCSQARTRWPPHSNTIPNSFPSAFCIPRVGGVLVCLQDPIFYFWASRPGTCGTMRVGLQPVKSDSGAKDEIQGVNLPQTRFHHLFPIALPISGRFAVLIFWIMSFHWDTVCSLVKVILTGTERWGSTKMHVGERRPNVMVEGVEDTQTQPYIPIKTWLEPTNEIWKGEHTSDSPGFITFYPIAHQYPVDLHKFW